jgi:soluble lytic murein transglycosylase
MTTDYAYLEELRLLQKEGDDVEVDHLAQKFNAEFSTSPLRSEVLVLLASIYKKKGQVEAAVSAWKEVAERYSGSALAPIAMFDWATLLWNKDRDEEARSVFEQLTQQYPRHEKAAEAWYAIGRIWQEKKEDSRAAAAYDRLASLFSGSQLAREGRWRQGWMAYCRRDFHQAEQIFSTLAKTFASAPEGESALYWQARAQDRQSLAEKAEAGYRELLRRYPDGYYALLAEKRLNLTSSPLKPGPERSALSPALSQRQKDHYQRSQELVTLGFPALARRELDVVKDNMPQDAAGSLFLLAEYSRMDGYATALRYAQELARANSGGWMRYLYPQAYWPTITTHAQTKGLDPYLILALIRQESLFDPEAVSPARAYGLMQLLQKTAARVTRAESVSPSSLMDPEFNINAGTGYLRQLLDQFNGNQIMAVAAYNAGESAVDKWRTRYADLEPDEFVESISFRETRNYVKFVMRNYRTYRRLYENGPTS